MSSPETETHIPETQPQHPTDNPESSLLTRVFDAGELAVRGVHTYIGEVRRAWLQRTATALEHRENFYEDLGNVSLDRSTQVNPSSTMTTRPYEFATEGGLIERFAARRAARRSRKLRSLAHDIKMQDSNFGSSRNSTIPPPDPPKPERPPALEHGFWSNPRKRSSMGMTFDKDTYRPTELPDYLPPDKKATRQLRSEKRREARLLDRAGDAFGAHDLRRSSRHVVERGATKKQKRDYKKWNRLSRIADDHVEHRRVTNRLGNVRAKLAEQDNRQTQRYESLARVLQERREESERLDGKREAGRSRRAQWRREKAGQAIDLSKRAGRATTAGAKRAGERALDHAKNTREAYREGQTSEQTATSKTQKSINTLARKSGRGISRSGRAGRRLAGGMLRGARRTAGFGARLGLEASKISIQEIVDSHKRGEPVDPEAVKKLLEEAGPIGGPEALLRTIRKRSDRKILGRVLGSAAAGLEKARRARHDTPEVPPTAETEE